jgi:hypothetical protein
LADLGTGRVEASFHPVERGGAFSFGHPGAIHAGVIMQILEEKKNRPGEKANKLGILNNRLRMTNP